MKKKFLIIPIILFLIDRLIKYIIPSINSGDDLLKFQLYKNFYGPFSLILNNKFLVGAGFILIIIFFIIFQKELKKNNLFNAFGILFILLGGLSNFFDRLFLGYVIDYMGVLQRSFFNIADVMIITGVLLFIFSIFYNSKDKKSNF